MKDRSKQLPKINYTYVILTEALLLFVFGSLGFMLIKANRILTEMRESVDIIVELKQDTKAEQIDQIMQDIRGSDYFKKQSLKYIDKEEGAQILTEELGEEFLIMGFPNPLHDVITFNMLATYLNDAEMSRVKNQLLRYESVRDVFFESSIFSQIAENFRWIAMGTLIVGIILIVVVLVIIHNTVRLAIYANRFLLKNMQLVGASWSFIKRPYLRKSVYNGFVSSLLAVVLIFGAWYWLDQSLGIIGFLDSIQDMIFLFVVIFVLGISVNWLSTYFTISRYLKLRMNDLY